MPAQPGISDFFHPVSEEWGLVTQPLTPEDEFARLVDEWRAVAWHSGGTSLLNAMGFQYNEVYLCRGLAWLLDPRGGHGLGSNVLNALLARLGLPVAVEGAVDVSVEESRADTRADIIVRTPQVVLIIEAKVLGGEQPEQADRLATHWARESPALLFLTRSGHAPYTAVTSAGQWSAVTWRDMANLIISAAADAAVEPSHGAHEFVQTIGAL